MAFPDDERSALAAEDLFERELLTAPRRLTGHLFHYTSVKSFLAILASGKLRLSPYARTNDLWESQPWYPNLSSHSDSAASGDLFPLWAEIDQHLRRHTKVGCLTQDISIQERVSNPNALRGWAHLSLWAHYGEGHRGLCLRFDRDKLIASLLKHSGPSSLAFHGAVRYLSQGLPIASGIDLGQVAEYGVDAVALAFAENNKEQLFFRKHIDWSNETEYRLVLLNQSDEFDYIDITDALIGVILGSAFPRDELPRLRTALNAYPGVGLERIGFHQRVLYCEPVKDLWAEPRPSDTCETRTSRRIGTLTERLQALRSAATEATQRREDAVRLVNGHVSRLHQGLSELGSGLAAWPRTDVKVFSHIMAVPAEKRGREPGVPGEVIHYEHGFMCVVENLPAHSCTLVAAGALQVLDEQRLRLHGVVTTERWLSEGNERVEHWRAEQEIAAPSAGEAVTVLLEDLRRAALDARPVFDHDREVGAQ